MNATPIVSVVMCSFNEPPYIIEQAITSILKQTFTAFELIIIDDSDNVETIASIDTLAKQDDRVIIIRQPNRIGFVPALNIGLSVAKGRYIARMDGDDEALPEKLAIQIAFLDANPSIDVVGSSISIINNLGEIKSERHYPTTKNGIMFYSMARSPFAHPTILMRRSIIDSGYKYDEKLTRCEDIDLWLRLFNVGYEFANIDELLLNYRVIGDLATKRKDDHWITNRRIRIRNFSWRRPVFGFCSVIVSTLYTLMPRAGISYIYRLQNGK